MGTKARNKPGGGMLLLEGQCSTKVLWSAIAGELRDGGPCSSKDARNIDMFKIPEAEICTKKNCTDQQQKEDQGESLSFVDYQGKHSDKG